MTPSILLQAAHRPQHYTPQRSTRHVSLCLTTPSTWNNCQITAKNMTMSLTCVGHHCCRLPTALNTTPLNAVHTTPRATISAKRPLSSAGTPSPSAATARPQSAGVTQQSPGGGPATPKGRPMRVYLGTVHAGTPNTIRPFKLSISNSVTDCLSTEERQVRPQHGQLERHFTACQYWSLSLP